MLESEECLKVAVAGDPSCRPSVTAPAAPHVTAPAAPHVTAPAAPHGTAPDVTVPVVVVAASRIERRFLRSAIDAEAGVDVVGEAATARDALALVERVRPAAVVLDLDLPGADAIEVVERLMATVPMPILVISSEGDAVRAAQALAAGAVDVVARPASPETDPASYAAAVQRGVRVAVRVRVIAHPRARLQRREPAALTPPASVSPSVRAARANRVEVVAIGASTGGPQALAHVLGALPADFGAAVVVVQHMADGFMDGMAGWLDGLAPLPVRIAAAGIRLQPGTVTVAPSARNLIVRDGLRVGIELPPTTQFHVPGVDATFESVARTVGSRAVGVLLTGMGRDGACGLKAMRDAGAVTIGQDEESSAVWGMPAAAVAEGAVQHTLPLSGIAEALVSMVGTAGGCR